MNHPNQWRSPSNSAITTVDRVAKDIATAFDTEYRTGTWRSHRLTRETIEASLAYALEVDKGGRLTGKEIQYALRAIDAPDLNGKKVLDYCCGTGITAIYFALCGAEVWAFDVSAEAIKIAKKSAEMSGVSHSVHFCVSDAQSLPYENDFFDVVFCLSALHIIIDYTKCPYELARVLKPGGVAVFCEEGLGYNPLHNLVHWLKCLKWIRYEGRLLRYPGRLLRYPDIEQFGRPFSRTEIQHFNLLMQVKKAFRGQLVRYGCLLPWSKHLLRTLEKADSAILAAFPSLEKYCGAVVVSFMK